MVIDLEARWGNKGQDMKEELIKFVMERANGCYSDDFPIYDIEMWIREFFQKYQPERLNPEDAKAYAIVRSATIYEIAE